MRLMISIANNVIIGIIVASGFTLYSEAHLVFGRTTMTKIIKEMLPPDVRVARDTQDLLIECCVVCNREERRTIAPEHVLKALEVLGFGEYIEEVYAAYEQHRLETVDTVRAGKCNNGAEMTEEEALKRIPPYA
ncbi:hypothetical protein RND71_021618 [Anisodus tanguticus]|uniref:Transcription factor CBF/NF-Y/archaeal histone domain-containing protein n=1 Tax=Anisodus tanguticus TaxID=243964 RepID=A0AAE1RY57_9SOLA|nr:hypothetical protein RND71_021618 [Anisodus tanguticus]